jgi:hypothetical protein
VNSGDGIGRHPAVPQFPINFRSIIWPGLQYASIRVCGYGEGRDAAHRPMAGSILLALVAVELALGAAVAIAYWRRVRRMRIIDSIGRVSELVGQATDLGKRAQDPELSLAERTALLEETRAALEQAMVVLRSQPRQLELVLPPAPPAAPEVPAASPQEERPAA